MLSVLVIAGGAACDAPNDGASGEAAAAALSREARPPRPPYVERAVTSPGRVSGWVEIEGAPPPDSTIPVTLDTTVCGSVVTDRPVMVRGNRVADVVVWLDDIRAGKALPLERRFEVTNTRCALVPRIQAVLAGGTLNVRSVDPVEHRTRITRRQTGAVLAVVRETDAGQVVPNDQVLREPGILSLTCEVHPWTHAAIAVFDHPYFATTAADGAFALDSIPAGRYRIVAWHPRLGTVADSVTIGEGEDASVSVRFRGR